MNQNINSKTKIDIDQGTMVLLSQLSMASRVIEQLAHHLGEELAPTCLLMAGDGW